MENQTAFPFPAQRAARNVWSVSGLLASLKQVMEREFFDVWIEGEISNLHTAASRHCYFTLKDGKGQIKAAIFAAQARYLKFKPADGMQVLVRGRLSLYESRGELQCYVEHIEPLGRGGLQLAFEQLKEKLEREGLFAAARKRPLPRLPRRIGLVTSGQGAAVADMVRILRRRFPNLSLLLYPVQVQGVSAPGEICAALDFFASLPAGDPRQVDLLIVGRGGGSIEDLWAFNDEGVARAIVRAVVPVISAVGHETDFTIADFVADLRAPTPSAAAELAVRPKHEFVADCVTTRRHLEQAMRYRLLRQRQRIDDLARHRAFQAWRHRLAQLTQSGDELGFRLRAAFSRRLAQLQRRVAVAAAGVRRHDTRNIIAGGRAVLLQRQALLLAVARREHGRRRHRLERLEALLRERNPLGILERGYALVYDGRGQLATRPDALEAGEDLRIRLASGWLDAVVKR